MKPETILLNGRLIVPCLAVITICLFTFYFIRHGAHYVAPEIPNTLYRFDTLDQPLQTETLLLALETAYEYDSNKRLERFLQNWHDRYRENETTAVLINDTLRSVYELFAACFVPGPGLRATGKRTDTPYRYAVIQQSIPFYTLDLASFERLSLNTHDLICSPGQHYSVIEGFRPRIRKDGVKSLYLTDAYLEAFDRFLGTFAPFTDSLPPNGLMAVARPKEECRKRWLFLSDFLYIQYGHWGGYWLYNTPPWIGQIVLNRSLDKAIVELHRDYAGDYILMNKTPAGWVMHAELDSWIE